MTTSEMRYGKSLRWMLLMSAVAWAASSSAQDAVSPPESTAVSRPDSVRDSVRELRDQVRELQAAVAEMRTDWRHSQEETAALRRELAEVRTRTTEQYATDKSSANDRASAGGLRNVAAAWAPREVEDQNKIQDSAKNTEDQKNTARSASLDEEYQLLSGKVDDQYQTKVESASKYRVRLSGIALMNLVSNQGVVDSLDLPTVAYARTPGYSEGSFGATLRQSEIGLEAFGPTIAGAKTRADIQLDFAGGFANIPNGINSGILRLRTANMRMDWTNTSVVVGQDSLFFSPISPTSFASLAEPALSYAGNLWGWIPQIRVEHRVALGQDSNLLFQGGILDPVSGEVPNSTLSAGYYRQTGPGEASRQPAYGTRIAWTRNVFGQPLQLGAGGFYSRQDYGFNRNVDGWAGMADVSLPLSHQFSLSGKFYRGRAVGGLYGAFGQSVLFNGDPTSPSTEIEALNSIGGWAQLKYRPANKWEFNAAFGMDNPYAKNLKYFPYSVSYGNATLAKNQGSFVNMIYRPRSDLLFSAEYRHLTTYSLTDGADNAGHLNLMMGVLF
jgi:regulator of replication initiation timing